MNVSLVADILVSAKWSQWELDQGAMTDQKEVNDGVTTTKVY